jgi:oxygen-independent coproporphyrinogen-3 oxidase
VLNIDLIYGLAGQDRESWLYSLERALEHSPAEIYLYPLYVRPLTGLGKQDKRWSDLRQELYTLGCRFLRSRGFRQTSMRMFQSERLVKSTGPEYCCQKDGMVGIGAGARSYTQNLHYAVDFAVGAEAVRSIIDCYSDTTADDFLQARNGFRLDLHEQQRRVIIQSLLQIEGLSVAEYTSRFGSSPLSDLPILNELISAGLAILDRETVALTEQGMAMSDAIGFELYSDCVKQLMTEYDSK